MGKINYESITIYDYSKESAIKRAPFKIKKDITLVWQAAGSPTSKVKLDEFFLIYLDKNTNLTPGIGVIITVIPGYKPIRWKCYEVQSNPKVPFSKAKWETFLVGKENITNQELFKVKTKKQAISASSKLYRSGFIGNIKVSYRKELPDDFASAMEFYYVPTVNTRLGTYICAGCK